MRAFVLTLALVAAGFLGWTNFLQPPAGFAHDNDADASRPIVVKIHADYCATCVDLGPTWTGLDAQAGETTRMIVLDVTNEERFRDTVKIARYMGVADYLQENMEATGTIAVFHGATRKLIASYHGEKRIQRYLTAIEAARQS